MTTPDSNSLAWLETAAMRRASDILFGLMTLIIGGAAMWGAREYGTVAFGALEDVSPGFFPAVAGGLLCVVGVLLLMRAALGRSSLTVRSSRPLHIAIAVALIATLIFAVWTWGDKVALYMGPAEYMLLTLFILALAISLAHSSRLRATGMVLLGLLLSTVGMDGVSGVLRFTMGLEELMAGIDGGIALLGLFMVGDAILCLVSPQLFLRTYTRLISGWKISQIPGYASLIMRLAAALVFVGSAYFSYGLALSYFDLALLCIFGMLGVAAKIFGWNRFLLHMGISFGGMLEGYFRMAMLSTNGDPLLVLKETISGGLFGAAILILAGAAAFSIRRAKLERSQ